MHSKRILRERVFLCLVGLVLLLNAYYSLKLVVGHAAPSVKLFLSGFSSSQDRAPWILGIALFWVGILALLERTKKFIPTIHPPSFLLTAVALGMLIILALGSIGVFLPHNIERLLFCLPGLLMFGFLLSSARNHKISASEAPVFKKFWFNKKLYLIWFGLASLAAFAWLVRLLEAWSNLAWFRGPASGDEVYFWWSAADFLSRHDFYTYFRDFHYASYYPAYPFAGLLFTIMVPEIGIGPSLFVLPFLFGLLLFWAGYTALPSGPRPIRWGVGIVATATILQHDWVFSMFFMRWYGEALAILVVCGLFYVIEDEKTADFFSFLQLFGLGVLAALVKPPLSSLVVIAFFPGYFLIKLLLNKGFIWREQGRKIFVAFAGAILAQMIWGSMGKPVVYSADINSLLHPLFTDGSFPKLFVYFSANYKQYWLNFLLIGFAILLLRPRKYLAPLLTAGGLVISVFLLYATQWKFYADYESGGRYILHGMAAWTLYAAPRLFVEREQNP